MFADFWWQGLNDGLACGKILARHALDDDYRRSGGDFTHVACSGSAAAIWKLEVGLIGISDFCPNDDIRFDEDKSRRSIR